ncbi:ImmA/IrrE family metallo-endopeptidase [Trueperella pecoris]|uniref:ImmA/IrrE family metallo-endopeptidase n=1 Tax=Trueperella pecoris TaxID=2733571 RepID=UPI0020FFFABD|nr:ImmA/IrrE family metallo-endopeptidase [Trueperella pecoris]
MRTLGNKSLARPSANLLDTIYDCQARQEWYRDYAKDFDLDTVPFAGSVSIRTSPVVVAQQIRELLAFDLNNRKGFSTRTEAFRALIDRIEGTGVLVMVNGIVGNNTHRKLSVEEFRGFALSDPVAPLIFVNGADTKAAQIFTIIHEFAHLWLGHSAVSNPATVLESSVPDEQWCNNVAAEVLVPLADLQDAYRGGPTNAELDRLANLFKVSTLVVLKRIYDAQLLPWPIFQRHYDEERKRVLEILSKRASQGGGNYYKTQPLRLSRKFAKAVFSSTYAGSTSFRDAYQLLGMKKHSIFENLAEELGAA